VSLTPRGSTRGDAVELRPLSGHAAEKPLIFADRADYMIWLTTPPSTRMAAPEVPEAASLQR